MKLLKITTSILTLALIAWLLFSWIDVITHNNPMEKYHEYNPINVFVLMGEFYE